MRGMDAWTTRAVHNSCYGNGVLATLWRLMVVAMGTRCGCALTPCGYADMWD